jgi:hypothetical protein
VDAHVTVPPHGQRGQHVGSAAEEAGRLFAAVEDWVRERSGSLRDAEHLATGSPECSVCPVCQAVHAIRQVKPETVEHLLDAAASVVAARRTTLLPQPPGDGSGGPAPSPVQRIDVREAEC